MTKNGNNVQTHVCFFRLRNLTEGAVRYQQVDADGNALTIADGALVGTLYLRKSGLGDDFPKELTVDIYGGKRAAPK